jgi:acyl-CoA hydrolase
MGVAERVPVSRVKPEERCDDEHASVSPSNVVRIVRTDASDPFER